MIIYHDIWCWQVWWYYWAWVAWVQAFNQILSRKERQSWPGWFMNQSCHDSLTSRALILLLWIESITLSLQASGTFKAIATFTIDPLKLHMYLHASVLRLADLVNNEHFINHACNMIYIFAPQHAWRQWWRWSACYSAAACPLTCTSAQHSHLFMVSNVCWKLAWSSLFWYISTCWSLHAALIPHTFIMHLLMMGVFLQATTLQKSAHLVQHRYPLQHRKHVRPTSSWTCAVLQVLKLPVASSLFA